MHLLLISGDDEDDNYGDYDDYDEDDNNDNDDETDDGCDDDDYAVDNDQGSSCEGTVTGPAWLCTPATHRGFSLSFFRCFSIFSDVPSCLFKYFNYSRCFAYFQILPDEITLIISDHGYSACIPHKSGRKMLFLDNVFYKLGNNRVVG